MVCNVQKYVSSLILLHLGCLRFLFVSCLTRGFVGCCRFEDLPGCSRIPLFFHFSIYQDWIYQRIFGKVKIYEHMSLNRL